MGRSPGAGQHHAEPGEFDEFVRRVESRLRVALVATYGSHDGRAATVDALSWAWEHWDRLRTLDNPVGYLFRVGQSASRRYAVRPIPLDRPPAEGVGPDGDEMSINPALADAIRRLPVQQRTVVMLVHAFGWTQRDVAQLLEVNPSTVREHLGRALTRLTHELEVRDVR
jgi:DNA-directed RNA polymerase specialized sigma24 family protein